jgi:TerC family integral membrane protein
VLNAFSTQVWLVTVGGLLLVVLLDLLVIARRDRMVTTEDATKWVLFYVGLACAFAVALLVFASRQVAGQFVAGYIAEYSLSVDNLFVFVIIMSRFAVPATAQDKVLYIGIVLSMLWRVVFIGAGAAAIAAASWVFYLLGALLLYTATKLLLESGNAQPDYREGLAVRVVRRVLPTTDEYVGRRLVVRAGRGAAFTPLVVVIAAISVANVVFALDSIPAIFGLTHDAYIVITANAFALMGLRQLYFLLGKVLQRLAYLNIGLAVILGFIGAKLLIEALQGSHVHSVGPVPLPHIGIVASLTFIVVALAVTVMASAAKERAERRPSSH